MIRSATTDDLRHWRPCSEYTPDCIDALRRQVRLTQRATGKTLYRRLLGVIPDADLIWLLCHEPLMTPRQLRLSAADCAARALLMKHRAGRKPDRRSYAAVRAARRFASGEIGEDALRAARSAARSAAWSAAESATLAATWAARSAAWSAAESASWAASRAAELATRAAMESVVAESAESATWAARCRAARWRAAWAAESAAARSRRWQLRRLAKYLGVSG